jgi:putative phosphoribosyl transferase
MSPPFRDRRDAGERLATALISYAKHPDTVVIGLPRGGVPVAAEVARLLELPLNILLVRKISTPDRPELAIGAIAEGGFRVLEREIIADLQIPVAAVDRATGISSDELAAKVAQFRAILPFPDLGGKTVILVDDGIATGASIRAVISAILAGAPRWIVVAAPIGSRSTCDSLLQDADEVICWSTPDEFGAVSQGYEDFEPTTDQEVETLLRQS